ncbi:MAG: heme ABC exporter ATP-binding protein CcmA [Sphingomonadaceae bacterium]|nr:heme ABC exporter ATP-binding protein CcmA [Sphingomonadaceae bacterium]
MEREGLGVEGLAAVRGGRLLFDELSFKVAPGGCLRVAGPNGAGKSTLLRMIAGLLAPAAGRVTRPARTAYVGHENALKLDSRLGTELLFWAGIDGASADALATAAERFALTPLLDLPCRLLSNGQRRRTALARAAASCADLWLLDEPEAGLDLASTARLAAAVAEHRAGGGIVVFVSHGTLDFGPAAEIALDSCADATMLEPGVNN